jgi:hypothetical protein
MENKKIHLTQKQVTEMVLNVTKRILKEGREENAEITRDILTTVAKQLGCYYDEDREFKYLDNTDDDIQIVFDDFNGLNEIREIQIDTKFLSIQEVIKKYQWVVNALKRIEAQANNSPQTIV